MSTVSRIELYHVAVPLPATFYPSWIPGLPRNQHRCTVIRILTDDGIEGWSAGPAMGREREGLGELIGPYLLGMEATDIDLIQQRLREAGYLGWHNWWIEPAFWDIKGKLAGEPVWRLLGGEPEPIEVYASTGEVKSPEARIEEVEDRWEEGFETVKLRVHQFDERDDIRQVQRTAEVVGDRIDLAVDANQGWRVTTVSEAPKWDLGRAKRFADACAEVDVAWLEEPLAMDAYDELAELTDYSEVPIAGGELHTQGLPELKTMIERDCYDVFQPDAMFTGGIAQTIEVARLCREHGKVYTPHTWTNGIGFAVNLQLMLASGFAGQKALEYPIAPPGWTVEARDALLEEPFVQRDGRLDPPTAPGLGFNIDRETLDKYGERFFVMDKKRLIWFSLVDRGIRTSLEIEGNKGKPAPLPEDQRDR